MLPVSDSPSLKWAAIKWPVVPYGFVWLHMLLRIGGVSFAYSDGNLARFIAAYMGTKAGRRPFVCARRSVKALSNP